MMQKSTTTNMVEINTMVIIVATSKVIDGTTAKMICGNQEHCFMQYYVGWIGAATGVLGANASTSNDDMMVHE